MKHDLAMRVSFITIIINIILSVGKLLAGIFGSSAAMVSDAVHSASDVFSTIIVIIGIRISRRKADFSHQYGHERLESVASILLAAVLCVTGAGIGYSAINNILNNNYTHLSIPTLLPLVAAVVSIIVKEWMYWYTRAAAKKLDSTALMADAWHHRSDALSSIGSFAGILGARLGYPILDSIASLIISVFIIKASYDIFKDAISKLTDRACDKESEDKIRETILGQSGVIDIDDLKTRLFGSKIFIDVEISVASTKTLYQAHDIAEEVHSAVETQFPAVKHCMVHVNPREVE